MARQVNASETARLAVLNLSQFYELSAIDPVSRILTLGGIKQMPGGNLNHTAKLLGVSGKEENLESLISAIQQGADATTSFRIAGIQNMNETQIKSAYGQLRGVYRVIDALHGHQDHYYTIDDLGLQDICETDKSVKDTVNLLTSKGIVRAFTSRDINTSKFPGHFLIDDDEADNPYPHHKKFTTTPNLKYATSVHIQNSDKDKDERPAVGAAMVFPASLNTSESDTKIVSAYSMVANSVFMSMAKPYLDVKLITNIRLEGDSNQLTKKVRSKGRPFSIGRFLDNHLNAGTHMETSLNISLAKGVVTNNEIGENWNIEAGMEIFTSPQTMVNADGSIDPDDQLDPNSSRDPFRPFMSLIEFSVSVAGIGGISAEKTAAMKIRLHDRTRLNEVAHLVSPDGFGTVRILVEYGWYHGAATTPVTRLINSMRSKDYYNVVTSNFNFDGSEVDIDLELATVGSKSIYDIDIGSPDDVATYKDLKETLDALQKKTSLFRKGKYSEIKIPNVLESNTVGSLFTLNEEGLKNVRKLRDQISKESDLVELGVIIDKLFGTDPDLKDKKGKVINQLGTGQIAKIAAKRVEAMKAKLDKMTIDPFLSPEHLAFRGANVKLTAVEGKDGFGHQTAGMKSETYISLGYLITGLLGPALHGHGAGGMEVLFVFDSCNKNAGASHSCNLGQFPLKKANVKTELAKLYKTSPKITARQLVNYIADRLVSPQKAYGYGVSSEVASLSSLEKKLDKLKNAKSKKAKKQLKKARKDKMAFTTKKDELFKAYYAAADGIGLLFDVKAAVNIATFDLPGVYSPIQLTMKVDSGPKAEVVTDSTTKKKSYVPSATRETCRLTFYDSALDPKSFASEIMEAVGNKYAQVTLRTQNPEEKGYASNHDIAFDHYFRQLRSQFVNQGNPRFRGPDKLKNLLVGTDGAKLGFVKADQRPYIEATLGNVTAYKQFLRRKFPNLLYGTETSCILNADLSLSTDSDIFSARISSEKVQSDNTVDPDLPLLVIPSELTLDMLGCPYLGYAQQYFIDFGTNTTLDGFYACIGVEHTINNGEFKTVGRFTPMDAYGNYRPISDRAALERLKTYINSQ